MVPKADSHDPTYKVRNFWKSPCLWIEKQHQLWWKRQLHSHIDIIDIIEKLREKKLKKKSLIHSKWRSWSVVQVTEKCHHVPKSLIKSDNLSKESLSEPGRKKQLSPVTTHQVYYNKRGGIPQCLGKFVMRWAIPLFLLLFP